MLTKQFQINKFWLETDTKHNQLSFIRHLEHHASISFKAFDSFIFMALPACVHIPMSTANWESLTLSELMSGISFT